MKQDTKILLISKKFRYLIKYREEPFHTKQGMIDLSKIQNFGDKVRSSNNILFTAVEPTSFDLIKKNKRGPQVILPKDAGMIIAYCGIGYGSKVLDAGTGSGWMASFLEAWMKSLP